MLSFSAGRPAPLSAPSGTHYLADMWRGICAELSLEDGPDTVTHDVDIALVHGPDGQVQTKYSVGLDSAVRLPFVLERRVGRPGPLDVKIWGQQFADLVSVTTADHRTLVNFLNRERRSMILQLMQRFRTARISNKDLSVWVNGTEPDRAKAICNMGQLVGTATILRPCWADVALDERSVMQDLFGSGRDLAGTSQRFEDLYRGNAVHWVGEAMQVGEAGHRERWAAMLVGSADGRSLASGRVVAMVSIAPDIDMDRGDVVSFGGTLLGLDAQKRYFRIA